MILPPELSCEMRSSWLVLFLLFLMVPARGRGRGRGCGRGSGAPRSGSGVEKDKTYFIPDSILYGLPFDKRDAARAPQLSSTVMPELDAQRQAWVDAPTGKARVLWLCVTLQSEPQNYDMSRNRWARVAYTLPGGIPRGREAGTHCTFWGRAVARAHQRSASARPGGR